MDMPERESLIQTKSSVRSYQTVVDHEGTTSFDHRYGGNDVRRNPNFDRFRAGRSNGRATAESNRVQVDGVGPRQVSDDCMRVTVAGDEPSDGGLRSSGRRLRETKSGGKWPWFLWLSLKYLGLFWSRPVVGKRCCQHCYQKKLEEGDRMARHGSGTQFLATLRRHGQSYLRPPEIGIDTDIDTILQEEISSDDTRIEPMTTTSRISINNNDYDDEGYSVTDKSEADTAGDDDDGRKSRCRVCDALWWDGKGQYRTYSDKDIGLGAWNHRGSGVVSVFLLCLYTFLVLYDIIFFASLFWGRQKDLLRYISYMTYLIFGSSVPFLCIFALIQNIANIAPFAYWPHALDSRYIVRRLQYLDLPERGLPNKLFLVACVGGPLFIVIFRLLFYTVIISTVKFSLRTYLVMINYLCVLTLYGVFSYTIYLLRISFEPQLRLDVSFVRQHVDHLDLCRAKLASTVQDFKTLRQLTNGFMVMVFGLLTMSVATQVTWIYILLSHDCKLNLMTDMYINALVAIENLTFFCLPCFAIGGASINFIWVRFRYRLLELRRARHERFWYRLLQFLREQDPVECSMRITMLFTLIGLFVALQFGDQNVFYYPKDNSTENLVFGKDYVCFTQLQPSHT
ncbi:uncharacterized protein [Diadema antillarum]|uniref:uncharacterized protein n=1 Tax=Diadema antillarum TaxID=105358 RepID=UPI003A893B7F